MSNQVPADRVNEIAEIIWKDQIPVIYKMRSGAAKPRAIQEKRGEWWMGGVQFSVNPAEGGFIDIGGSYNPNRPKYVIKILLDEGADTYIMERWLMKPSPVCQWKLDDVYFDQLGELLDEMTTKEPPAEEKA